MSVSTLEHHSLAVDEHLSASILNLSEAVLLRVDVATDADVDGIEIRFLSTPKLGILHFEAEVGVLFAVLYARYLQDSRLDGRACRVHKFHVYAGI